MTDAAFGRLLYTDCAPGTGRGGGGGFQIQAQSPAVDPSAVGPGDRLAAVRGAERVGHGATPGRAISRSGSRTPAAEGYGTAQSRYLGKEAVGGRLGNHLADCLLTRDPELYGTIRPAQLWRSADVAARARGRRATARTSTATWSRARC